MTRSLPDRGAPDLFQCQTPAQAWPATLRGVTVLGLSETVGHRCTDSGRLAVTTNRLGSAQAAEYLLRPTCIGKGMVKVGGLLWQAWVEWVG